MYLILQRSFCAALITFHSVCKANMVMKPYGSKMCISLCLKLGSCLSPLYMSVDLTCILTDIARKDEDGGVWLKIPKRDVKRGYRKLNTNLNGDIIIKDRGAFKHSHLHKVRGYKKVGKGVTIKEYTEPVTWMEARATCETDDGRLLKIHGMETFYGLRRKFRKKSAAWWIGLKDIQGNNKYIWIDGSHLKYKVWSPGEPNHSSVGPNGEVIHEDCCMLKQKNIIMGLQLYDEACTRKHKLLCERRQ